MTFHCGVTNIFRIAWIFNAFMDCVLVFLYGFRDCKVIITISNMRHLVIVIGTTTKRLNQWICGPNRLLSRRLDRCDRVIHNESGDPNGGNMCSFSGATCTSRVRHNADYVPYAKTRFDL